MNSISLPEGGFLKYASFFGQVIPAPKCACGGQCALASTFEGTGLQPNCNIHYFMERHGNKAMKVPIPERYATVLNSYKKVLNVQKIAPYNQEFEFFRVLGVHGDIPNTNGDLFRWGSTEDKAAPELLRWDEKLNKPVYATFVGKGNYKDHQNDSVIKAVGILLDSVPNHKVKGVELLVAVDKQKDPMLVRGINQGYITDVSMGARVTYSICSICDKVAHNEFEYCFLPDTKITMSDGTQKFIKDIIVGEQVLTGQGNYKSVIDTLERKYDGNIMSIHYSGSQDNNYVTPNHRFYIWNDDNQEPKIVRADELKKGDYIMYPINHFSADSWIIPEMCWLLGLYIAEGSIIYQKRRVRPVSVNGKEDIIQYLNDNNWHGVTEVAQKFNKPVHSIHNFYDSLIKYGYGERNNTCKVGTNASCKHYRGNFRLLRNPFNDPEYIKKPYGVSFDIHKKEKDTLGKKIIELAKNYLGCNVDICERKNNGIGFRIYNSSFASLCIELAGTGAKTKKLSQTIMDLPYNHQLELMRGWLLGDGHYSKKYNVVILSTASSFLAQQFQTISFRLGASPIVCKLEQGGGPTNRNKKNTIYQVTFRKKDYNLINKIYNVGWKIDRQTQKKSIITNDYILRKIIEINSVPYIGNVYNIEVQDDHTYVAGGMACLNCSHIKNWKGNHYSGPETNWMPKLAYEDNRGVEFIELSWVTVGADNKAKYLEKIAHLNKAKNKMMLDTYITNAMNELNRQNTDFHKVNNYLNFAISQAILL